MSKWDTRAFLKSDRFSKAKSEIEKILFSNDLSYKEAFQIIGAIQSDLEAKQEEEKVN
ncbi:hypothetical protein ACA593_03975 [Lactiplantibacillus pentosus]|uniref:Phage protein n=1 Tax=Lactiplantibacillus pentosus TaxID=1589 RepID=A0AAW8VZZ2_LACPE|nr:hypothetical protein [Lactiplantibacillus pentosus]MBU7475601.1 hypothetical protein [Lactiplantibacillus pentosus]MBU7530928.1 hypothetical protein [Lactiplantibacillus pentosus]MDT6991112.1 hypothetical protein [Lactiplantibacillus pentosus]MDT6991926.1 hypothetical protein [Lactiplantibacillus pentosus]